MIFIYSRLHVALIAIRDRDEGQGLTEYALIGALIALLAIAGLKFVGDHITSVLSTVGSSV
jgi:Flp pilus assembly pilin Flp